MLVAKTDAAKFLFSEFNREQRSIISAKNMPTMRNAMQNTSKLESEIHNIQGSFKKNINKNLININEHFYFYR
jgi:hypothetical protein